MPLISPLMPVTHYCVISWCIKIQDGLTFRYLLSPVVKYWLLKESCYLQQVGYVFIVVGLFVCLLFNRIAEKPLKQFKKKMAESQHMDGGKNH